MDESVSSFSEPLDIEASASTARDRSDGAYRFIDAMQAARRLGERDPGPPVELHLSAAAREYAERLDREGRQDQEQRRKPRGPAYPPRPRSHGELPDSASADVDRSNLDD